MNRRELLKFSLLSPLLGLFKSRKSGASTGLTSKCQGAKMSRELKAIHETYSTSSEGQYCVRVYRADGMCIASYDSVDYFDPNSKWAKECTESCKQEIDNVILKSL
jgi:hypothetical protein